MKLTEPIHPQDLPWDGRFEAISDLLRVARTHTLPSFLSGQTVATTKSDGTLVTEVDQQAEVAMRNWLSEHFAQDAVVGEEGPVMHGVSNWTWVLDPIDVSWAANKQKSGSNFKQVRLPFKRVE